MAIYLSFGLLGVKKKIVYVYLYIFLYKLFLCIFTNW